MTQGLCIAGLDGGQTAPELESSFPHKTKREYQPANGGRVPLSRATGETWLKLRLALPLCESQIDWPSGFPS